MEPGVLQTDQRPPAQARTLFVTVGIICVLAGGLVAAAGGEAPSRHLSWAAAYLVLVCGLAQGLLGAGQFLVAADSPTPRMVAWELVAFNLGNAGVVAGTLAGVLPALDVGSAVLLGSLGLFAWATRTSSGGGRLLIVAFRAALVLLALSVPIGVVMAR